MPVCVVIRDAQELSQMREFGLQIAQALNEELEIWSDEKIEGVRTIPFTHLLATIKKEQPRLLIVGKHADEAKEDPKRLLTTRIFERADCQVLVIRLVDELPKGDYKILVPCAGGRNSRRALTIAHAISGTNTVAFQMRSNIDDLSRVVGLNHLEKISRKANVPFKEIEHRVVLGDDFLATLRDEMATKEYGMLLIGASGAGTLRRKLFGSLPEKLLNQGTGMTVGVIRAERSTGHRVRDAVSRLIQVKVPQLNRNERLALFDEIESKSRWSFDFAALMGLATTIAGLGLLADSAAVVIGAMLVAPLMMPLIGSGLALVQGNWPLCQRAISAVIRGFLLAFTLGLFMGLLARWLDLGLTPQLIMRGKPNILDLGVAFVSGIAAAYCVARPKLSGALAGVAIAAALVPPIATVGISLALGSTKIAQGAALLFGTNVVAVILGAAMSFFLAGIRGTQRSGDWARRGAIILTLICAGLTIPLGSALLSTLSRDAQMEEQIRAALPSEAHFKTLKKTRKGGYEITVESPHPLAPEAIKKLKQTLQTKDSIRIRTELVIEE